MEMASVHILGISLHSVKRVVDDIFVHKTSYLAAQLSALAKL